MSQKSLRRPTQWMVAMSCRRPCLSEPACGWTPHGFCLCEVPFPLVELPERGQSLTSNRIYGLHSWFFLEVISWCFLKSGYFRKTAGVWNKSFPSPMWAAKGYRATPASLPDIPLVTRSQQEVFAYDQVVWPNRSYRPSGVLNRVDPRTLHTWNCLQLSGARGVDNGGFFVCQQHRSLTSKTKWRVFLFAFTDSSPPRKDTGVFEIYGRFIIVLLD